MSADLTLADRVAALEDYQLTVADLPLKELMSALERRWQPNAADLLEPGSFTAAALAGMDGGFVATPFTATAVVTATVGHALGAAPTRVLIGGRSSSGTSPYFFSIDNDTPPDAASIKFAVKSSAGAVTDSSVGLYWLALA